MVRTAKLRKKSVYDPNKNIIMDINDEEEIKIVGNQGNKSLNLTILIFFNRYF